MKGSAMAKEFPMKGSKAPGAVKQAAKVPSSLKGSKASGGPGGGGSKSQKLSNGSSTGILRNPS